MSQKQFIYCFGQKEHILAKLCETIKKKISSFVEFLHVQAISECNLSFWVNKKMLIFRLQFNTSCFMFHWYFVISYSLFFVPLAFKIFTRNASIKEASKFWVIQNCFGQVFLWFDMFEKRNISIWLKTDIVGEKNIDFVIQNSEVNNV